MPRSIDPDKYWYGKGFDDALLRIRPRNKKKAYLKGYRDGKHYGETREKYGFQGFEKNAGRGKAFTFHGSATSKLMARKLERRTPGSFIQEKDGRYYILKPKKVRSNPRAPMPGAVKIYDETLKIDAVKHRQHYYGGKLTAAGQRYFHSFDTKHAEIWGLPDGSLLIRSKK